MIYIDRNRVPIPSLLKNGENPLEEEILFRLKNRSKFKQARFKSDDNFLNEIYENLIKLFDNKCAYCESEILNNGIIDRFRPSDSVIDTEGDSYEGYYYLSTSWFNLYLSCHECHRYKSNYFPVIGARIDPPDSQTYIDYGKLKNYVSKEQALLVDPCDIDAHNEIQFRYHRDGHVTAHTKKANYTIELLQLNRSNLIRERAERIIFLTEFLNNNSFSEDLNEKGEGVLYHLKDMHAHLGLNQQMIAEWYLANEKLLEKEYSSLNYLLLNALDKIVPNWKYLGKTSKILSDLKFEENYFNEVYEIKNNDDNPTFKDSESKPNQSFSKFMEWVEITDYKCIKHLKLDIPQIVEGAGEQSILLIGENGVGKSTVLQAISLAMLSNKQLNQLKLGNYNDLIRYGSKSERATIQVKFLNEEEPIRVEITPTSISSNRENLVKPTIGIGSVRRMPEDGENVTFNDDPSRILALFRHDVVFPDVVPWLSDVDSVSPHQFNEAAKTIIDMLMIPDEMISEDRMVNRRLGKVTVNVGNGPESIKSMCDGYRSVIGYALYIMRSLNLYWESAYDAEGLIIIDEIGNHLHPTWKIKIISLLRSVFPRCTLIVSTHDPLCLRAARKGEVWVMNLDKEMQVQLTQKDIPMGMSIENLLIGDWFYMDHTTDEQTSRLIEEHSKELFKKKPDQEKVKFMEAQLEQTVMQTSTGLSKLDTYLDLVRDVKSEEQNEFSKTRLDQNPELRKRLADQIRRKIKK